MRPFAIPGPVTRVRMLWLWWRDAPSASCRPTCTFRRTPWWSSWRHLRGRLDLLLYLIRRRNLDLLEVSVSKITDQYMRYIELMQVLDVDLAGEYLAMAATLTRHQVQPAAAPVMRRRRRRRTPAPNSFAACRSTSASRPRRRAARPIAAHGTGHHAGAAAASATRQAVCAAGGGFAPRCSSPWRRSCSGRSASATMRCRAKPFPCANAWPMCWRGSLRQQPLCRSPSCSTWRRGAPAWVVTFLAATELLREGLVEFTQSEPVRAHLLAGGGRQHMSEPKEPLAVAQLRKIVEAALMAADEPLSVNRLAALFRAEELEAEQARQQIRGSARPIGRRRRRARLRTQAGGHWLSLSDSPSAQPLG